MYGDLSFYRPSRLTLCPTTVRPLNNGIRGRIAYTGIVHGFYQATSLILHKFEAALPFLGGVLGQDLEGSHGDADGVAPADRVVGARQVVDKGVVLAGLDGVYGLVVYVVDVLVDRGALDVGPVAKVRAPVAEVGAHDPGVVWVLEVGGQQAAKVLLIGAAVVADEDGHDGGVVGLGRKGLGHALVDVGQVHLERVLLDVVVDALAVAAADLHVGEAARVTQLLHQGVVDRQVAKGRGILGVARQGAALEVVGVRGAQHEDALRLGQVKALVGPGGAGAGVLVACVSWEGRVSISPLRHGAHASTDGAMTTLAPRMGSSLSSTVSGTAERYWSSSSPRELGSPSYQLSAWLASRVPASGMVVSGCISLSRPGGSSADGREVRCCLCWLTCNHLPLTELVTWAQSTEYITQRMAGTSWRGWTPRV
jgi:hypothetical protein